jgi:hypothetical protein
MLRLGLLVVLTLLALSMVTAIGRPETGPTEKLLLVLGTAAVVAAGAPIRRIGAPA